MPVIIPVTPASPMRILEGLPRDNLLGNYDGSLINKGSVGGNGLLYYPTLTHDSGDLYYYNPASITWTLTTLQGTGFDIDHKAYTKIVISGTRINIDYSGSADYLGGTAMPLYCLCEFDNGVDDPITSLDRSDISYWNIDNQLYDGYDAVNSFRFLASELMRLPEFLKSLQPNWYIFLKKREADGAIEQIVIYQNLGNKNCLEFDGSNDYVDLNEILIKSDVFSIEGRFKIGTTNVRQCLFSQYIVSIVARCVFLANGVPNMKTQFYINDAVNTILIEGTDLRDDEWHILKVVSNGSGTILYEDGVEVDSCANSLTPQQVDSLIGIYGTNEYTGLIDYVIVTTPNKTYLYDFEEGSGDTLYDKSPAVSGYPAINGTLVNFDLSSCWVEDSEATPTPQTIAQLEGNISKITKSMKDTTTRTKLTDELYINIGVKNPDDKRTASSMLNDALAVAIENEAVEIIHSISSDHELGQTTLAKMGTLKLTGDDFYLEFPVGGEYVISSALTSTYLYVKGENGWTNITLADSSKIQYSDLVSIDYKLYGIISSDIDYNNYWDDSEIWDDSEVWKDTTLD